MILKRKYQEGCVAVPATPFLITAKSGLKVNPTDDTWIILPNKGRGYRLNVGWVHLTVIAENDRELILGVFTYYIRTKAAGTAASVVTNVKPFLINGIPSLKEIKSIWGGLKTNNKKGLNQFFGTLSKQGYQAFGAYHEFTSANLDKTKSNSLDPSSGALSAFEFDSLAKKVNEGIRGFDWTMDRQLTFYSSPAFFGRVRNLVTNKLLLSIVRRPIQIATLKWADLIPAGAGYYDDGIRAVDEVGTVGGHKLQLRVYIAKSKGMLFSRERPERFPLHLSEDLSNILVDYKRLVLEGIKKLLASAELNMSQPELLGLMDDLPMFPDVSLFKLRISSLEEFRGFFTPKSTAYHIAESSVANAIRWIKVSSDRASGCIATSNRIRHTVLTRGAQDGLPASHLAQITGVTVPAARHYIDLDYPSRRAIDASYIGNKFMRSVFRSAVQPAPGGEEVLLDGKFNAVGGVHRKRSCLACPSALGRPLGCYGCPNFRPLLEADHKSVLADAENKLALNRNALINPLYTRSIEKLERQIAWVKLTIEICDENLSTGCGINA
jgi:hypothetical protein